MALDELKELESLYQLQASRIGLIAKTEDEVKALDPLMHREMDVAMRILGSIHQVKTDLGILGREVRPELDFKGYSRETAAVFAHPESRRRIISIIERLKTNFEAANRMLPDTLEAAE